MKLQIQQKIQVGFAVALAFLLLTGVTAWWSEQRNAETFRSVEHTYQVLDQFETTLVEMLNTETEGRGFVLSGDETFLQPQQAGIAAVQQSLAAAKRLTQDNPDQQRRLAALEPLIQKKISHGNEAINLRRSGDTAGALQLIATGQGQQTMDEIRKLVAEMEAAEEQLLQQRTAQSEAAARTTKSIVTFGGVLSLVLVGLASIVVRRDFERRQRAEAERDRFFNLSLDLLGIAKTDGYFKRVNPAFTATLGWSAKEILARPFIELIHPNDRAATVREVEKLAAGQPMLLFENRYLCKDGAWKTLAWRAVPQPDGTIYCTGRDMTESKLTDEALHRSEESLAITLNSIGDAVLATDTEGRVTRMNPIAEKLMGWTLAVAQGRPIAEVFRIINEETRQPAVIPVEKVLASGKIQGLANHTIVIARDGTERPIADSAAPIRDKDGLVLGVVLVFRDVTEEKRAEKAIRESERQLRTLNEELERRVALGIRLGITERKRAAAELVVADKKLVFQNEEKEKRAAELVVADKELVFQNEEKEKRAAELVVANKELLFQNEEKEKRAAELVVANKELLFQNEEKEKRAAEMRQALLTLDATDDGAFIFDPETLRFTYVNQGAIRQLGYTQEELLGLCPMDIKVEFNEAKFRELLAPMLRGKVRTHRLTTLFRRKDGHDFPVEINLQYVTPAGEHPRFICMARDITERLKNERLALRTQRLESIGTLAGGISHDLNNALAPILLGVEILKTQYPQESQIVDMFEASARRGADMVRQLLTFAKGAEGERVALQPGHLVKELVKLMEGSFPKNIELVVKCDPKLPLVLGDATQLHQVLLNLCVNARDAMPHGGTLTLEAQQKEVDAIYASSIHEAKPGKYVVLRVRDTGTGIPPEIIDRIFDPFFTTKSPDKGTGLGLSTVMGIVKGHGGFLEVHSQPGQGSTFAVYLPAVAAGGDTQHITKAAVEFRGQEETILFVDDERALREAASMVLRRLNFKPLTAIDGADGLIQAAQHRTELRAIITDLSMPHMDGLEFVRAVRRLLPDIPIMVASGRMEDAVATEFKTLGVTNLLDKPFTEAQLAEALKTVFKK